MPSKPKKTLKLAKEKQEPKPTAQGDLKLKRTKFKIIGIGDGAGTIVSELALKLKKADFLVANTDWQKHQKFPRAIKTFYFGDNLTGGWGTGNDPEIGRLAAQAEKEKISKFLKGADLCFLVACLGGGTGSGSTPVFAKIARDLGILTLGIFTLPFQFEGAKKLQVAKDALEKLRPNLNAFLVIPNEKIFQTGDRNISLQEAFLAVNKTLANDLEGLIELIFQPGLINIDFADLKAVLEGRGKMAYLSVIEAEGEKRLEEIKKKIFKNVFQPYNFHQAKAVLFNICSDQKLSLGEVAEISQEVFNSVSPEAKIIFGINLSKKESGKIKLALLAIVNKGFNIPGGAPPVTGASLTGASEKRKEKKTIIHVKPLENPVVEVNAGIDGERSRTIKSRRNGLQVKQELKAEEELILARENVWETPPFLRRKLKIPSTSEGLMAG